MRTITELIIVSLLVFSSTFFIGGLQSEYAGTIKKAEAICPIGQHVNQGADGKTSPSGCKTTGFGTLGIQDRTESWLAPIVNTLAALVLAGSIISFIYSGYEFIMYGTNQAAAERAKNRVLQTGLAIVVTLSVFAIYRLIASLL